MKIPILRVFDENGKEVPIPAIRGREGKPGPSGDGSGDMVAAMYDPQARREDIFEYVDNNIAEHTHDLEELGAAAEDHTHAAEELGVATEDHTHTAEELGVAPAEHTHSPEEAGAAAEDHTHSLEDLGAASADHTHTAEEIGAANAVSGSYDGNGESTRTITFPNGIPETVMIHAFVYNGSTRYATIFPKTGTGFLHLAHTTGNNVSSFGVETSGLDLTIRNSDLNRTGIPYSYTGIG